MPGQSRRLTGPSQDAESGVGLDLEQGLQGVALRTGKAGVDLSIDMTFCLQQGGRHQALDDTRSGRSNGASSQFLQQQAGERRAAGGSKRHREQPLGQFVLLGSGEGLEPVDGIQSVELIISGLRSGRVVGQDIWGKVELIGDENQYLPWHDFAGLQQAAGEPQGTELDGKAQAIVRPPAPRDDGEVGRAECVMPDQVGLGRRQREQCFKLGVRDGATRAQPKCGFPGPHAGMLQLGQNAAIYCRVSTVDQSCERQERDLRAFAERAGYLVIGVFKESGSGAKLDRIERRKVMALAQAHRIDAVLVTELSRWGRSTLDLLETLRELEARRVSLVALSGMTFDLASATGRMMATMLAGIAEFERDLLRERVRSGLAAARARGKVLGRQLGQRPKSDRLAPKVLALVDAGRSYRLIGRELGLSKNTVADIVKRRRVPNAGSSVP
jgi:putative DNA-invertase from lambdoid prophage Rac